MEKRILFGTDGWRAIIADAFTFSNVRLCAQGIADYLRERGTAAPGVVVGYDTRFASEDFAAAVAEVLAANEIPVLLCDEPAPTPVISHNIVAQKALGAIVITASHNPPLWNGIKFKPEYAGSATPEVTEALERHIAAAEASGPRSLPLAEARRRGQVISHSPQASYLHHVQTLVDIEEIKSAGLKVVVDSMYGAGIGYIRGLLKGGATQVIEIHGERNPAFPGLERPEPIAPNLGALRQEVLRRRFDIGLATDGDADRVGGVDERGEFFTPLQFFALLILYQLEARGQRGPLVKSVTTTSMAYRLGELYDIPVYETPVGFKYLGPKMLEKDALIAGEESGGFGFRGHIPERDGLLSALFLLDFMARTKKTASGLVEHLYKQVGPHHYDRLDLEFPEADRPAILERVEAAGPTTLAGLRVVRRDDVDGYRYHLEGGGWLLIRFSGTEPLLRIYSEVDSPDRVARLLAEGRQIAGV